VPHFCFTLYQGNSDADGGGCVAMGVGVGATCFPLCLGAVIWRDGGGCVDVGASYVFMLRRGGSYTEGVVGAVCVYACVCDCLLV
jgi:hypothetical protein